MRSQKLLQLQGDNPQYMEVGFLTLPYDFLFGILIGAALTAVAVYISRRK